MATAGTGQKQQTAKECTESTSVPTVMEIAEEKRSKRNPKQLDFNAAMEDFHVMFPDLDTDLIEAVLRANHGSVDDTIDQLLSMNITKEDPDPIDLIAPPILPPKPAGSLKSSADGTTKDHPPELPPREGSLKRKKTEKKSTSILYNTPETIYDSEWNGMKIPLLGKLPSNFLRIVNEDFPPPRPPKTTRSLSLKLKDKHNDHTAGMHRSASIGPRHMPKSRHGHLTTVGGERLSTNAIKRQIEANQRRLLETCDSMELDSDTARYLEDERLALVMQNEEFLRELKRNEDFMRTLEFERDLLATRLVHEQQKNKQLKSHDIVPANDRPSNWMVPRHSERDLTIPVSSPTSTVKEDPFDSPGSSADTISSQNFKDKTEVHDFRDQLRNMGASSKKKFAVLARKFFATTKKRRKVNKILRETHGVSTMNLLDDNDDDDLIDAANSQDITPDSDVMFEPLPENWITSAISEENEQNE